MRFRFDELIVEKQFRDRLDEFLLGIILIRPKRLKKASINGEKIGMKILVTDKLAGQNNEDAIKLVINSITDTIARGIAKVIGTTNVSFFASPLTFEYIEGEFDVDGVMMKGTEVVVTSSLEEGTND